MLSAKPKRRQIEQPNGETWEKPRHLELHVRHFAGNQGSIQITKVLSEQ